MKKMLAALALCITMAFEIPAALAYEYTPYVGDGYIKSAPVTVKLEKTVTEGEEAVTADASGVADATEITASCRVKPGSDFYSAGDAELQVCLVLAAYKGSCLVAYALSDTAAFSSISDPAKELTVTLDKRALDADGVKVYLWDSIDNARPLLNMGEAGSNSTKIDGIIIGGAPVALDEETKTGSVEVNAGYVNWPEVIVLTEDLTTDVSVDVYGAFPLSRPVHTLLNANTEVQGESGTAAAVVKVGADVYHISVTQAVPQITDVRFRVYAANMATAEPAYYSDAEVKVQYDVQNPVWTDALPGPHKEIVGKTEDGSVDNIGKYYDGVKSLENLSAAYSNRAASNDLTMFFFDIAPELLGSQYIAIPWPSVSNADIVEDCYTFTIDRSARIYMNNPSLAADPSWTRASSRFQNSASNVYYTMYYEFRQSGSSSSIQYATGYQVYYKDFDVKPGTTCTISLPAGAAAPKVFIKYADTNFVTNASYTKDGTAVATSTTYVSKPVFADPEATTDKYKFFTHGNKTATSEVYGTGNLMYCTSTFLDDGSTNRRQYGLVAVPDELAGGVALLTPFQMTDVTHIDFDLSASARVYMFTTSTRHESLQAAMGDAWTNTAFVYEEPGLAGKDLALAYRSGDSSINETIKNQSSFYRDYIVQPGEGGHVTLELPTDLLGGNRCVFIIQPLEG